jgi:phosphoribosylformylglycinamidine synthase subunit PurQ / glutaminase
MSAPRVAILQFPGVNCEAETARALRRAALEPEVFRWTRAAAELSAFDAFVLPGGFSYQDRVRAGALAAKSDLMNVLAEQAESGKPVLGICNGAQVLVESGLLPHGDDVELALARNRMTAREGYYTRWIYVRVEASNCVFTRHLGEGTLLPLPVAHGEGRFTSRRTSTLAALARAGQTPLSYATPDGGIARSFPDNPNGSQAAIAAVCNPRGNVLAMMPHPERALDLGALGRTVVGEWGARRAAQALSDAGGADGAGPGAMLFEGLARHLAEVR